MSTRAHRRRRLVGVSFALTALLVLAGGLLCPAAAHPFGDPESASIRLSAGNVVRVHWEVGMLDDYTYLAQHLGLLPEERIMLDGAVDVRDDDAELLAGAPEFRDYLLAHIGVVAGGATCRGEVTPISRLAENGVDIDFTCPEDVFEATVDISMLTDLSEFYTTMATGPNGQRQVYDGGQTSHDWSFDPSAAPASAGRSAAGQLGLTLAAIVLLGAIAHGVRRHLRRRAAPATSVSSPASPPLTSR